MFSGAGLKFEAMSLLMLIYFTGLNVLLNFFIIIIFLILDHFTDPI